MSATSQMAMGNAQKSIGPGGPTIDRKYCVIQDVRLSFSDDRVISRPGRFQLRGANPKPITDIYLLVRAVQNHARLPTFDRNIAVGHVIECATDAVEPIPH
jgi:hypothetical protein